MHGKVKSGMTIMIKVLIKKEVQRSISSLRYILVISLTLVVFIFSAILFVNKYEQRRADYQENMIKDAEKLRENAKQLNTLAGADRFLLREPRMAELIASGGETHLPDRIHLNAFRLGEYENIDRLNYKLNPFIELDWVFIVGIVLSFAALVLTFDRISGERENGTLRLQCSNPVSRMTIMAALYLANLLLLSVALCVGLAVNLLIVSLSLKVNLLSMLASRIFFTIILFLLYLSFFLLVGLFVSGRVRKSSTSLAISLLLWTMCTILLPAGCAMLGQKLFTIRSSYEFTAQRDAAWSEIWSNAPVPQARGFWGGRDFPYLADRVVLVNRLDESNNAHNNERFLELLEQVNSSMSLTRISPYSLLRYAVESSAGTGLHAFVSFYERAREYRTLYKEFIITKDQVDPDSYHQICSWIPVAYSDKPVAYEEIPEFATPALSFAQSLGKAGYDCGLLLVINMIAAMCSFIAFMRYDVR